MTAVDSSDIDTISTLSAATAASGTDKFVVFQGSDTGKAQTHAALATFVLAQDATTQATGTNDHKLATTGFVQQERVGKNYIRNSSFDIWQAGTSFAGVVYSADLWKQVTTAGRTYSRQAGFNGARYSFQAGRDSGQTGTTNLPIGYVLTTEEAMALAGKQVMISADVVAGANFSGSALNAFIVTGTGTDETFNVSAATFPTGSANSGALTGGYLPTTTPGRHSWGPYTMPSGITEAAIRFNYAPTGTAGAADYYRITRVKLEEGATATPYQPEPYEQALIAAMRRYQKSFRPGTTPAQNVGAGTGEAKGMAGKAGATAEFIEVRFPVMMHAIPTITLYNPAAANGQVRDLTAAADCSAAAATENLTEWGVTITATGNASTAGGNKIGVHWVADDRTF